MREKRTFSASFKAKVAIEALREQETLSELSKKYNVHQAMISKWKNEFIKRGAKIFSTKEPDEVPRQREKALFMRKLED